MTFLGIFPRFPAKAQLPTLWEWPVGLKWQSNFGDLSTYVELKVPVSSVILKERVEKLTIDTNYRRAAYIRTSKAK